MINDLVLEIERLHKRFPVSRAAGGGSVHAVAGIDLSIGRGEIVGLVGESGCGKSTVGLCVLRLLDPDSGTIRLDGTDITRLSGERLRALRPKMHMVFQDPYSSLNPRMRVADIVAGPLRAQGSVPRRRLAAAVDEVLSQVGLDPRLRDRYPHQLSGGQRQRVALARALAVAPSVLLLDEPLSALDARVRVQLRDEIRRLQLAEGITTLFVTHDQSEALAIADRVAVLNAGRLEQVAPPQEVYASPATAFVATFVGVVNRLSATVEGPGRVTVLGTSAALDGQDGTDTVIVRPEALAVAADGPGEPGTVVTRTFLGAVTRLVVATAHGEVTVDAVTRPGLPDAGEPTVVRLDTDRVRAAS